MAKDDRPALAARRTIDVSKMPPDVVKAFHLDRVPFDRPRRATGDLLRLDGKTAIVTGGGGDGLGNAICHRLAEQGATIAILDVDADAAAQAAAEIGARWSVEALPIVANVADWEDAQRAVASVVDGFGTVDILVNNAGGSGSVGPQGGKLQGRNSLFVDMTREAMEITVGVNLWAP